MTVEQTVKFMEQEYCNRTGKNVYELTQYEKEALQWSAEQMDTECLIIQSIYEETDVFPPKAYLADFISFPIQYLSDDNYEGRITKETGIVGARFFMYDTPEDGRREDIQDFIKTYREYEKTVA